MSDGTFVSYTAGGTITKYAAVYVAGDGDVEETTAATDIPLGIAQSDAVAGDVVSVQTSGFSKAIATDGAVAAGELLSAVASGEVDTNAGTATHYYFARADEASGAAGEYIEVEILTPVLQA